MGAAQENRYRAFCARASAAAMRPALDSLNVARLAELEHTADDWRRRAMTWFAEPRGLVKHAIARAHEKRGRIYEARLRRVVLAHAAWISLHPAAEAGKRAHVSLEYARAFYQFADYCRGAWVAPIIDNAPANLRHSSA